ncbi:four helix bundle protein [Neolewinella aurantiaca]|uniref:Four helix bundle protein n=1 Tax=Neolewinella aurantiaca TaxID=2602767 RepID=A0A5C7F7K6_9BACT|nr:four helix bundle protein [Neolewinella aurantiaca]TXF85993.1 four helix bundle protein [Neolewinella aurantiaca]
MSFQGLQAYDHSFKLVSSIFRMINQFPKEEDYSLTDQIRRSSRSVTANLAESFGRRAYPTHFQSQLADCASENIETQAWLDFSLDCGHISPEVHAVHIEASERVGRLLSHMQSNPDRFLAVGLLGKK